jgi:hypothetical protein
LTFARATLLALAVVAPLVLSGCLGVETTREKSAKRARLAAHRIANQKGLTIGKVNPSVRVEQSAVVQDPNGVAAVIRIKNRGSTQAGVPVAVTVSDAHGKKLYANNIPGLDPSLVSVSVLEAGQDTYWVNNQILVAGKAKGLKAEVGVARVPAVSGSVPKITLAGIHEGHDQDGFFAKGSVRNDSSVAQKRLVISCVARAGQKIHAAGRAIIERLPPASEAKKPTSFTVYFIGDPKGAPLDCAAPPTVLPGGAK